MTFNTFLFDLDGTLVDTKIYSTIYNPLLEIIKSKLSLSSAALEELVGERGLVKKDNRWDTGTLCRELGFLEDYYRVLEDELKKQSFVFPEAREVIGYLSLQGKQIGIVSNSMKRTIITHLRSAELIGYIHFTFSSEDAGVPKREESYWQTLIVQHGITPEKTIMVGDNELEDIIIPGRVGIRGYMISNPSDLFNLKSNL